MARHPRAWHVCALSFAPLVSHVDLAASLAALAGVPLEPDAAPDSHDVLAALLGDSPEGRDHLVTQAGPLAIVSGRWKLIEPHEGAAINRQVNIELGNAAEPQLFDLGLDPAERRNVAAEHPEVVDELARLLQRIREQGRSRRSRDESGDRFVGNLAAPLLG